jgi:protein-tyrosine phosphatase
VVVVVVVPAIHAAPPARVIAMAHKRCEVMFVCSGNTCRSPMAEHVLRARLRQEGLAGLVGVASSGLHVGEPGGPAAPRAVAALQGRGHACEHAVRRFEPGMLHRYDLIIAMDTGHERLLRQAAPAGPSAAKIRLLRSFDPAAGGAADVPDPVSGGAADHEQVLRLIEAAMPGVITAIRANDRTA